METLKRKKSPDEMEVTPLKRIKRTPEEIEDIILHKTIQPTLNIIEELYEDLRDDVVGVSVLGDFQKPLEIFLNLIKIPEGATALMDHLNRLSDLNGREVEMRSIFGAFLHVSDLRDHPTFASLPDVELADGELLADVSTRMDKLRCGLADALDTLLKINNGVHREDVLQFLAVFINRNASSAHIQADPLSCASLGSFVNLGVIMLRLCEPFLDDPTKMSTIDPRYVFSGRLELRGLTATHATSELWSKSTGRSQFDFTSECFFMTARVLNLGWIKVSSYIKHLFMRNRWTENRLKAIRDEYPSPPPPLVQQEIARMERVLQSDSRELRRYNDQILLFQPALSFYKVMLAWMIDLAGGFKVPAPATCPMNFAAIPEHFVYDAMECLMIASELSSETELAEFMNFIIMFMASPQFIQNPYLRAKMVGVLCYWIPNESANKVFKHHQPTLDYLVRNLLQHYANSDLQFSDKLNVLHLLKYLWKILGHRFAWKRIAKVEKKRLYLQFLNILMNDITNMLDEGLKPNTYIEIICFTTEEIVAPFLLPEMVQRVATTLNYLLAQNLRSRAQNELDKYELLRKIVKIYVNLTKRDKANVFANAITKDGRSYHQQLFGDAAEELRKYGEEKMMNEFMELGRKAKVLTKQAEEAELALGEIPEEFMDPVMSTLMTDPVIIPNTNVRIDRPVILRHLLNKNTDPFSGLPLTPDMLIPDTELKAKIDHFLQK